MTRELGLDPAQRQRPRRRGRARPSDRRERRARADDAALRAEAAAARSAASRRCASAAATASRWRWSCPDRSIKTVGVVGAGTMGNGIAQVFAQSGFDVRAARRRAGARRSRARDDREEPREVRREGQARRRRSRRDARRGCTPAPTLDDLADVDYVVEAIVEQLDVKRALLRDARQRRRGRTSSSASNTSSISITRARRGDEAARQSARHALHESGAADDARRADPRPGDVGRDDATARSICARRSARRRSKPPTTPASSRTAS